mmetsp:Transcript_19277/g.26502  ORF Transcript_19277/g.26502 Transcript_19277/m.26502 type:complete len:149 (+) Transcript_19277:58-504(+)
MDPLFENYLISRGIRPEEFTQSPLDKNKSELVEAYEKQIEAAKEEMRKKAFEEYREELKWAFPGRVFISEMVIPFLTIAFFLSAIIIWIYWNFSIVKFLHLFFDKIVEIAALKGTETCWKKRLWLLSVCNSNFVWLFKKRSCGRNMTI